MKAPDSTAHSANSERATTEGLAARRPAPRPSPSRGPSFNLPQAMAAVEARLSNTEETTARPVLVMMSGLPGTGKTYLARRLAEKLPFVILETDCVRKALFSEPTYSAEESGRVFQVCHALIDKLLKRGVRIIFDATNLIEFQRAYVYRIVDRVEAKLVIVRTVAPEEVVQARMHRRKTQRSPTDISDADWRIYKRMAEREQPISRPYMVIDTSADLETAVRKIIRAVKR